MRLNKAFLLIPAIALFPLVNPVSAQDKYEQANPHARGDQLLPYCQDKESVVSQLRCDYYLQGLADLAVTPLRDKRIACIPRNVNRTELMDLAVEALSKAKPAQLKSQSAAQIIVAELQRTYRCPKKDEGAAAADKPGSAMARAIAERLKQGKQKGNADTATKEKPGNTTAK